jgi:hypothetical protein
VTTFNFDEIELPQHTVTVLGHEYRVAELNGPAMKRLGELERKYDNMTDDQVEPASVAFALIDGVSVRLEPVNGGPPIATALRAAFEDGTTSLDRIKLLADWLNQVDDPPAEAPSGSTSSGRTSSASGRRKSTGSPSRS